MGQFDKLSAVDIFENRYAFDESYFDKENFFTHTTQNKYNEIVTDPPWNHRVKVDNVEEFYERLFKKLLKISTHDAAFIIITTQDEVISELCQNYELEWSLNTNWKNPFLSK